MNFRLDIVGLSDETKPLTGIENGTTYYTVDTQELYIFYKGTWYKQGETEDDQEEETTEQQGEGEQR